MQQPKLDWELKRIEILEKTNNDPEEIKKYVLNEKNTRITKKYIEEVFRNYGINYEVYDINIFHIAMTHPNYINKDYREIKNLKSILMGINFLKNEDLIPISDEKKTMAIPLGKTSYETLEYLGDSILRLIISDYLFIRFVSKKKYSNSSSSSLSSSSLSSLSSTNKKNFSQFSSNVEEDELGMEQGGLTKLRSQIEKGSSLAEMARKIGLTKYMIIPRNLEAIGAREKNNKFQCDIFEAFIAAIYFDSCKIKYDDIINYKENLMDLKRGDGFQICFEFVKNLIEDEIDLSSLLEFETNYKDELLQTFHKLGWGDPKYNLMNTKVDNDKMGKHYFQMYVRDNEGNIIGTGIGSSKQKGEKLAAKKALQYLKIQDDDEDVILDVNSNEINIKNNQ